MCYENTIPHMSYNVSLHSEGNSLEISLIKIHKLVRGSYTTIENYTILELYFILECYGFFITLQYDVASHKACDKNGCSLIKYSLKTVCNSLSKDSWLKVNLSTYS